ncbi:hypothetical protein MRY87_05925 [bacterium]|nr:hypothetical protein [bacterium]
MKKRETTGRERPLHSSSGAGMIDYLIATTFLGVAVVGAFQVLTPSATSFHNEVSDGIFMPYPDNYLLPTPTPTPEEEEVVEVE